MSLRSSLVLRALLAVALCALLAFVAPLPAGAQPAVAAKETRPVRAELIEAPAWR